MCARGKIGFKYVEYIHTYIYAQVLCKCEKKDSFSNEPTGGRFMGNHGTISVFYYTQILLYISNIFIAAPFNRVFVMDEKLVDEKLVSNFFDTFTESIQNCFGNL